MCVHNLRSRTYSGGTFPLPFALCFPPPREYEITYICICCHSIEFSQKLLKLSSFLIPRSVCLVLLQIICHSPVLLECSTQLFSVAKKTSSKSKPPKNRMLAIKQLHISMVSLSFTKAAVRSLSS